jgi:hypothetical protein
MKLYDLTGMAATLRGFERPILNPSASSFALLEQSWRKPVVNERGFVSGLDLRGFVAVVLGGDEIGVLQR